MKKNGYVYLVGAGCGKGLITVEGLRVLRDAEVVVYDDLIDKGLLSEAKADAVKIYVGKRAGKHSKKQDEINRILIENAGEGKRVVRLKGGDSFVFGRGGEEFSAVTEAGFRCRVIPGVSSAIAVPEHAGIPVTHRGLSRSFTVITG
ncbi:MAG: uroporphyrinogen-III C-methyltransferase, partial [Candidatus Weimeria sp.]